MGGEKSWFVDSINRLKMVNIQRKGQHKVYIRGVFIKS